MVNSLMPTPKSNLVRKIVCFGEFRRLTRLTYLDNLFDRTEGEIVRRMRIRMIGCLSIDM